MMIEDNTELLNSYDAARLVTISHCYSYPKTSIPAKAEVIHYTHLLKEIWKKISWSLTVNFLKDRLS